MQMQTIDQEPYHIPALLDASIEGLNIRPGGVYVDVTFGGGGHSRAILKAMDKDAHLYGIDRDMDAVANVPDDERFTFVRSDFRYIKNFLYYHGEEQVDGILADLGVSFHHFDSETRGFSFRSDSPLDMRMNQAGRLTAADILNEYSREDLETMLRQYTDLKRPGLIAKQLVGRREESPIKTTGELVSALQGVLNPKSEKKELSQVFQALRIEVNDEMGSLRKLLEQSVKLLKPGGRICIITYHSIEDRMVKNFFRSGRIDGEIEKDLYGRVHTPWKLITRSPIVPDAEEIERNPRSRSAKLRIAERGNSNDN